MNTTLSIEKNAVAAYSRINQAVQCLREPASLQDLAVFIEPITAAEYGDRGLLIHYAQADSPLGQILVASTHKGLCYVAFVEQAEDAILELKNSFPKATFVQELGALQQKAFPNLPSEGVFNPEIRLHVKGTEFQLKIWECLLIIPPGSVATYGEVGRNAGFPSASRAVGTAIGRNPVAYLIPCHRVIRGDGKLGGYRWLGPELKKDLLLREADQAINRIFAP